MDRKNLRKFYLMEGTEAESNEDYGMLFRLSQEGGITYTNLIQQVSVSPNANLAGAEVAGGLPLLQNTYGSFMQLLQAPIESEIPGFIAMWEEFSDVEKYFSKFDIQYPPITRQNNG
ncbi:hypothetical protein OsJ_21730 [Oryza sativa Japonica Group]|uniref:Uncharacterized protein n=1 Tax=Oryza sativa subsp. japonica TaxID=39947 RepID=A3BCV3_ORYSJ|nr:hypothetical protein OsJ_21730 [Oryza sativa Japonica Group]